MWLWAVQIRCRGAGRLPRGQALGLFELAVRLAQAAQQGCDFLIRGERGVNLRARVQNLAQDLLQARLRKAQVRQRLGPLHVAHKVLPQIQAQQRCAHKGKVLQAQGAYLARNLGLRLGRATPALGRRGVRCAVQQWFK